jgi:hypothetical protein
MCCAIEDYGTDSWIYTPCGILLRSPASGGNSTGRIKVTRLRIQIAQRIAMILYGHQGQEYRSPGP